MQIPEAPPIYTTKYTDFKGVDFTSVECDRHHCPIGQNFICDKDGLKKRYGYHRVNNIGGNINGMYHYVIHGVDEYLIHCGTKLYKSNSTFTEATEISGITVSDVKSNGRAYNDMFILLTGNEMYVKKTNKVPNNVYLKEYTVDSTDATTKIVVSGPVTKIKYNNGEFTENTDYTKEEHSQSGVVVSTTVNFKNTETVRANFGKDITFYNGMTASATDTLPNMLYISVLLNSIDSDTYPYVNYTQWILPILNHSELRDCYYSEIDGNMTVNIPYNYNGQTLLIPYITSTALPDRILNDENRKYSAEIIIKNSIVSTNKKEIMRLYNLVDTPEVRKNLTEFRTNLSPDGGFTYDQILKDYGGDATPNQSNLFNPFVVYSSNNFQHHTNQTADYYQGYVISAREGYGSNNAYLIFEDGSIYDAYVRRKKVSQLENSSDTDEKKDNYITIVSDMESYRYKGDVPDDKVGKPFKILITTEGSYKSFSENSVWKCKELSDLQYGNGFYTFFTRNSELPNRDWHSEINNPLYIPATAYTIYGANDKISGYGMYGSSLCVFKSSSEDDKFYLRSANYVDTLGVTFPVSVGIGNPEPIVAPQTIKNLSGEVLYLTNNGVYAVTNLSTSSFNVTRRRSYYIDGKLKDEPNKNDAISCIFDGKMLIALNKKIYVLDGRMPKDYISELDGEYSYQCYYFTNFPNIKSFCVLDDKLYFGDENGDIWQYNDESISVSYRYRDGYIDSTSTGTPIDLLVGTLFDDDGDFMSIKKIQKKGSGLLLKPFGRTTYDVAFSYDDLAETLIRENIHADIFDFNDIDFERFTFNASDNPRVFPFMKKSKKYKFLRIIIRSNNDEPFALISIIKRYIIKNYVKRG